MKTILIRNLAVLFLFILFHYWQVEAQEFHITPLKEHYLRDDVGLLNMEQREEIIRLLEKHNQKSAGRIYLDILPQLPNGKTIERYAYSRLNERPKAANEKADKIMLVIALKEKGVRIETSRDVRQLLTDEYCHKVNREIMIPKFKSGEYFAGLKAGIEELIRKLGNP